MVNIPEFIARLKKIISHFELSSSAFAEKLGVQRATISHLLAGRNKPSLDFVMKVHEAFPEVDLYWLLDGVGSFPKTEVSASPTPSKIEYPDSENLDQDLFSTGSIDQDFEQSVSEENLEQTKNEQTIHKSEMINRNVSKKEIDKILILYKDGSFEIFKN